ncbi:MAG: DUF1643 domain-containing protein [Aliarcobacter sp.]|jgi:hypothetical protein|nr:DUF1643 domain-containing protein [Aliarcobacter sp.]
MSVPHYVKVDIENIIPDFTQDLLHRSSLTIPLLERTSNNTICIIGQNPSEANQIHADPTLRYFEEFIFKNCPEYSKIIMLNLYSRIDTKKEYDSDLERPETNNKFIKIIEENDNFLFAFGASKKDGAYNFFLKAKEVKKLLIHKNIFKINLLDGTSYPPHPGNPKILYRNYKYNITDYE